MTLDTSVAARARLAQALELDLIGPTNDHAFARELLPRSPRNWYLTGMLVPVDSKVEAKEDPSVHEDLDSLERKDVGDDGGAPDKAPTRRGYYPSSIGLSFLVRPGVATLKVLVEWGEYVYEIDGRPADGEEPGDDDEVGTTAQAVPSDADEAAGSSEHPSVDANSATAASKPRARVGYRRVPHAQTVELALGAERGVGAGKAHETAIPSAPGLVLALAVRAIDASRIRSLPKGTLSVSLFLVNRREPDSKHPYRTAVFQPRLVLADVASLVPRSDLRGEGGGSEWDELVADLQYRDAYELAVGHGVAVRTVHAADGASRVETAWIPRASVERVEPARLDEGVVLSMEKLAALESGEQALSAMRGLVAQYDAWIKKQREVVGLNERQQQTLSDLSDDQRAAMLRIEDGIKALADPQVLDAFRTANNAMALQARRRAAADKGVDPSAVDKPTWRPFQLAFILMALRGIVEPKHNDRETVDLLFFPTGGGKTEAYLGLAAFTLVLRRLRDPGFGSAGVAVLMRYTLRLLTLDQLGRAAALVCALELERKREPKRLGAHPFEIGLWVGQGATPNRMGEKLAKKAPAAQTALARTLAFKEGKTKTPPIPLASCPWCGTEFTKDSFHLVPDTKKPSDLNIYCVNDKCEFTGVTKLPIIAVDEPLYRRLPCFVISTVDKFAALPWSADVGNLLGHVDRVGTTPDGPLFSRGGAGVPVALQPPDLVIQDELHLISGPLGTVAGIYEGAIDQLATRTVDGVRVRPKIVASTATVRRAQAQIRALFDRKSVTVFPPAGPDRRNSFFAVTRREDEIPGRLYLGVAAQGRSMKVVYLRALIALLAAGQRGYAENKKSPKNPMDPYMTVVGYFNSLRELGGSRRIAEDEISLKLKNEPRRRIEPDDTLFASRTIQQDLLELTSRVETDDVAEAKRRLGLAFSAAGHVDLALATNMISVGLDIQRLGLMVVLGQPKGSSEYIQATSRVGRDRDKPGLVVTLFNIHKPRDRSHYERFESYHQSFYRSVEATSVTPSAPRALDRALAPALVGLVRHSHPAFRRNEGAHAILKHRSELDVYAQALAERARNAALSGEEFTTHASVLSAAKLLLDKWHAVAKSAADDGVQLVYDAGVDGGMRLLREVLDPELKDLTKEQRAFRMPRSMRDVEAAVDLQIPGVS